MISNLHIPYEQDVVVFILGKNNRDSNFCYVNSYYKVCPLPFYGKYDDYGSVNDCHGIGLNYIIEAIRNKLVELEEGPNSYHDIPAKKSDFNLKNLFDLDRENRLFVEDLSRSGHQFRKFINNRPDLTEEQIEILQEYSLYQHNEGHRTITHVQVHRDIFNHIIDNFKLDENYQNHLNIFSTRSYGFNDVIVDLPEYLSRLREELKKANDLRDKDGNYALYLLDSVVKELFPWSTTNRAARFLRFSFGSDNPMFLIDGGRLILSEIPKMDDQSATELLSELLKVQWINAFLNYTRRAWIKPTGEGSQDSDAHGHYVLADAIKNVLDKEARQRNLADEF